MRSTAQKLNEQKYAQTVTWESLRVGGTIVIDQVLEAIDLADMCVFDLTNLNPNVLFEAGYAVSRGKPIWLTMDGTVSDAYSLWKEFSLLGPVGFIKYRNSDELVASFLHENPLESLDPIYDSLIEPNLPAIPERRRSILYCSTFEPFEAANRLDNFIDDRKRRGTNVLVSDPTESSLNPISWYAPILLKSAGVLINFAGAERNKAEIHNKRHALVAGLARGFDIPILLIAENTYPAPFDYEYDVLKYDSSEACISFARGWIDGLEFENLTWSSSRPTMGPSLQGLRFGEHVAENESENLGDYFVETAAFGDVVADRNAIFVGHRGTGKTANALQAFEEIASNKTNLPVLIKPPGFEFAAVMHVVEKLPNIQHEYFFDALWRFVIQTEIANTALRHIEDRPLGVPQSDAEQVFVRYANTAPFEIRQDVSVRLGQALRSLPDVLEESDGHLDVNRDRINEAFHSTALAELRHNLGPVLKDRKRVAVFVDNLDKGWEKGANFTIMARFILGLLIAQGRLAQDFARHDSWREKIKLTVAIFLRSDIYNYLKKEAREPDKLPISTIAWNDPGTLLTVIEERFLSSHHNFQDPDVLWNRFFCSEVQGMPIKKYLGTVILPRPRDIVYFCNAAVSRAIDRRNDKVLSEDFLSAEETYSRYAYEALLVENGVTIPEMEEALFGFLGSERIISVDQALTAMNEAGVAENRVDTLLNKLVSMSFIGLEIRPDTFHFPEAGTDFKRSEKMATLYQATRGLQRLKIHPAFYNFLDVKAPASADS
ncbi:hypothetical protein GCM10009715_21770 [Paeniglutamicibacter psychrophenolicus]